MSGPLSGVIGTVPSEDHDGEKGPATAPSQLLKIWSDAVAANACNFPFDILTTTGSVAKTVDPGSRLQALKLVLPGVVCHLAQMPPSPLRMKMTTRLSATTAAMPLPAFGPPRLLHPVQKPLAGFMLKYTVL